MCCNICTTWAICFAVWLVWSLLALLQLSSTSFDIKFAQLSANFAFNPLLLFHFDIPVTYLLNFRIHSKDITNVTFHRKYPLFASSSEDCTTYVCHGMVYSDLNQNPLIVPLEILRGHSSLDGRGMHVIGSIVFTLFFLIFVHLHRFLIVFIHAVQILVTQL